MYIHNQECIFTYTHIHAHSLKALQIHPPCLEEPLATSASQVLGLLLCHKEACARGRLPIRPKQTVIVITVTVITLIGIAMGTIVIVVILAKDRNNIVKVR